MLSENNTICTTKHAAMYLLLINRIYNISQTTITIQNSLPFDLNVESICCMDRFLYRYDYRHDDAFSGEMRYMVRELPTCYILYILHTRSLCDVIEYGMESVITFFFFFSFLLLLFSIYE